MIWASQFGCAMFSIIYYVVPIVGGECWNFEGHICIDTS